MLSCFSLLVFAIAGVDGAETDHYAARSDCISEGTIRNFQVLDESNLIVTAMGKRKYHLVLSRPAFGLQLRLAKDIPLLRCEKVKKMRGEIVGWPCHPKRVGRIVKHCSALSFPMSRPFLEARGAVLPRALP